MSFSDVSGALVLKVSAGPFEAVEEFVNNDFAEDDSTPARSRIADIALAVGLAEDRYEGESLDSDDQVSFNLGSVDKHGVMKTLVHEANRDADSSELRDLLEGYIEGGVREINKEIEATGVFDYTEHIPDPAEKAENDED